MPEQTEPFVIATLPLPNGGRVGVCRLPWLPEDLAAILAWRPAAIVSMTELAEMGPCMGLEQAAGTAGIGWLHLPIRDFSGPDAAARESWPGVARRLHGILDDEGSVLLHCRGGKGRSGMIALRLMVERGEAADAALERLRRVRPGAVETAEQLAWASGGGGTG